jgi:hypothetical protein
VFDSHKTNPIQVHEPTAWSSWNLSDLDRVSRSGLIGKHTQGEPPRSPMSMEISHQLRCPACGLRLFLFRSPEELEAHNPSASDPDSWASVRHTSSALFSLDRNHGTGRDATGEFHRDLPSHSQQADEIAPLAQHGTWSLG